MEKSLNKSTPQLSLLAITWPIFVELFLQVIMGSTDTIMLSHISDDAVAAVGVANQLIFLCILIFSFVSSGTAVVLSQYLGAGLKDETKKVTAISITLNLVIGLVISLFMVIFRTKLVSFFHLPKHIAELGEQYLMIVGGTVFLQAVLITVSSILRANGYTRDAMMISITMNVIHLIGNAILIFGLLGFPEMGVIGVSISTAISRAIALALILKLLYDRIPINLKLRDYITIDGIQIKRILKIGVPAAGEQICFNLSQLAITAIIAMLGAASLTTRVYTQNIVSFILVFGLAMGQGTQILIGYKAGARDFEGAYHQLLKSLRYSLIMTVAIAIVVAIFREPLLSFFTKDDEIISMGSTLLLLCLILEPGRTFNLVVINSLRATGDANISLIMGFISMWGISVPLAYFLGIHLGFGLPGIWIAFIVDEWFRGITMYFRWRSRVWEKKVLVQNQVTTTA
ncbi:MATE family efflux transporter [Neobacillus sp. 179-C4.2 HS]|uniref:MATE family efflux transporter n=1 Tax=Neobacillus driksii TaxID=3035913 RepID=A0ABV4Z2I4_9BACI|nr:MATE family efflux transporter [Neobacillus sp. 179.-C4.2 HS]MDP5197668.1 MATE family efflux transporter [Neobacillus sp. 179.-C4.2 HS]